MAEKEYIERETLKILFAGACAECRDSCAEFDGIEADCNQCLLNGVIKDAKSIPAADVRPVEWIPVTERRAEFPCICCDANGNLPFIPQGLLTITDAQGTWQIDAHLADPRLHQGKVKPVLGYGNRITHWMPLPEPPKAEEGE